MHFYYFLIILYCDYVCGLQIAISVQLYRSNIYMHIYSAQAIVPRSTRCTVHQLAIQDQWEHRIANNLLIGCKHNLYIHLERIEFHRNLEIWLRRKLGEKHVAARSPIKLNIPRGTCENTVLHRIVIQSSCLYIDAQTKEMGSSRLQA